MSDLLKKLFLIFLSIHFGVFAQELDYDTYHFELLDAPENSDISEPTISIDPPQITWRFEAFGPESLDSVQTGPSSHAASHAWEPMPNHNDNLFNDIARDNAREAMKESNQELRNNYEDSFNFRPTTTKTELPQQIIEPPAPTPPSVPLWDTIGLIDNLAKSENGQRMLNARIEKLTQKTNGLFGFGKNNLQQQLNLYQMIRSGKVSELMTLVQGANIRTALWAFDQLCKIWPYEHQISFLLRGYHHREDRLIRSIGTDFMKNTELSLVSRPDFLALFPDANYRLSHFQKEYVANQKQGNIDFLKKEFNHLSKLLHSREFRNDKAMIAQWLCLYTMLHNPITNMNSTIAHGTQKKAIQEIRYLSHQIDHYFAKNNITDPAVKYAHLVESGMLEQYNNAQRLLEARSDFAQIMQSELITTSYSVMEVGRALRENSDLLGLCQNYEFQHTNHLKTRIEQLERIKFTSSIAEYKEYDIASEISSFMTDHGLNVQDYQYCYGDRLVQTNHQEHLNIIRQTATLDKDSPTHAYTDCILDMVDAARELNQAGEPLKSMEIADVCWTIFECGTAICDGIVQGAVGAVADMIEHPIAAAASVAFAPQLLAYQLSKVALDIADVGLTTLIDRDLGKQKWDDLIKPINDCIDIITSQEISLQDKLKFGATVATQVVVQRKMLSGLGKFYKATKTCALEFVKNNPLATPEQYLVTADGRMMLKAAGPGKNGPSLKDMSGKGPKNSGLNPTTGRKINLITKQEFFKRADIKKNFEHYRDGIYKRRPNAKGLDKKIEYLHWDHLHNDVEAYNSSKVHVGSLDPETLKLYKEAVPNRDIKGKF